VVSRDAGRRKAAGGCVKEILLTGGNGFVGRHVVCALQERGEGIRVLALPREDTNWLEARGVAVFRGDIRDSRSLSGPMRGVDAVVHLAAMMDVWRPLNEYQAVNVQGTVNVCEAAEHAQVSRLVFVSSSSVYGMGSAIPRDESAPLRPLPDPYPITKAAADRFVRLMAGSRGLPAVVVRPDQIFGPGDEMHFARMADQLRARRAVIVGRGDNVVPLVYISDIVQGLLLALDHPAAVGQAYNITAAEPVTQHELLAAIARAIGVPPPRVRLPYRGLYFAGWLAERAAAADRKHRRPPFTRFGVAFLGSDNRFSVEKARRELSYEPQVDVLTGVRLAAEWYLRHASPSARHRRAASALAEEVT
jgi:2-alkyl-3-oxoalkanoate reductase